MIDLKIKTVKLKLKSIMHNDKDYSQLFRSINKVNDIIHLSYLFTRSYVLRRIESNSPSFNIDKSFINVAVKTVVNGNIEGKIQTGRPLNSKQLSMFNSMNKYWKKFSKETSVNNIPATKLSYIIGQECETMYISIINNIKYNFEKYVKKYMVRYFKKNMYYPITEVY